MSINNIRIKKTLVTLAGVDYTFFYSMAAAAYLTEKYGSATEAEKKLYSACFKVVSDPDLGERMVEKSPGELLTVSFFSIIRDYVIALTERQKDTVDIYSLGVDELPAIVAGVLEAIGLGNPDAKEQGSENPQ